ncbi:MAG: hypothetical protein ACI31I_01420 [Bacilli bacterium]
MNKILIYNNLINKDGFNPFSMKQYFAIPVIPIKVALKYDIRPSYNHFERAILTLLLNKKHYTILEIAEVLMLDNELVELIVNSLIAKGDLDESRSVTAKAENTLKGIYKESSIVIKYAFYDLNRGRLLKETIDPNMLNFKSESMKEYLDYSSNNLNDYYNKLEITSDSNDYTIKYSIIDLNQEKNIDIKTIESSLHKEIFDSNDRDKKVLISATIIDISNKKHYLLSYIETSINTANTNRWSVKNPLTLNGDLELQNFFYYSNSNKIVSLIIQSLMKSRTDIVNEDVDKKKLYDFIKYKLFDKTIDDRHKNFIEPLVYVLDSIGIKDKNIYGQNGHLQLQESLKMAMIYFGQLFENLLYQAAMEYKKVELQFFIDLLNKNKEFNNSTLTEMSRIMGFDVGNGNLSIFNTTKNDLNQMFKMGREYVLTACIAMNILIGNHDSKYFISSLAKKNKDFILKLNKLKKIRDERRHTTDNCDVTIKDYLYIVFDIFELAFGYKINQQELDEYFASKVSLYDYSYSHEYIRNRIGTSFFDAKDSKIITIKNHLIEMHKKYIEHQSDYIASAHSIVEDLFKEMLKAIVSKININTDFKLNEYFTNGQDFEDYIEMLGFDTNIDQTIFETEVNKALVVDIVKTESFIKQGILNNFDKSTNRIKMQSLILLFKLNPMLANDYLINQYNLKKLFKITSVIMYIDRSHKQNTVFNEIQATYIVDELLELVKNSFYNGKVINWRL